LFPSFFLEIDDRVAALTQKTSLNQFQCLECGKLASQRTDLKKHIEAAHLVLALPCHVCGQISKTRHGRQTHLRVHHGLREVQL
jgi:transcription elongation factor Elf1